MRLSTSLQVQHHYITGHGITQEALNKILRSVLWFKEKGSTKIMSMIAKRELRKYKDPNSYQYNFYHAWDPKLGPWDFCDNFGNYPNWTLRINRRVPPNGPRVRLVDINGEAITKNEQVVTRKK